MNLAAAQKLLLAPDAKLPQRDFLLDANRMAKRFSTRLCKHGAVALDACETVRVKYRCGANLRVLYKVRCGEHELKVAARTFPDDRGADVCAESLKNAVGYSSAKPVFYDAELQTVFWTFPNDRKISNLRVLSHTPKSLSNINGRIWAASRVVAYAPEKCATAECLDETGAIIAYAKVFAGDEGREIHNLYQEFQNKNARLPRALIYSETHRTMILEAVKGKRVADLPTENAGEIYRKFGAAIARFHDISPPETLPHFKRLDAERFPQILQIIKTARPDVASQAEKLCKKLIAFAFDEEPKVCLHGDVHAKNAIWHDGDLMLIDLDQVSNGNAACNIGSFLAGLHYKECTGQMTKRTRPEIAGNFLAGYAEIRALPTEKSLIWHTAAALFAERALRAVSRVRVGGLSNFGAILTRSENILRGGDL